MSSAYEGTRRTIDVQADTIEHLSGQLLAQRAELESLRRRERVLRNIIKNIPYYVFWKNRNSIYEGCNEMFARVAGLEDPDQIVGKSDFELVWRREEAEHFVAVDRQVIATGKAELEFEEPQHGADGTERWLLTSKVPLVSDDGEIEGILGIYTDITERKRMQIELARAKEAAEAASRAKSAFLASVSHELRTPLHTILGYLRLLQRDVSDAHAQYQHLRVIERAGTHLLELINEVLELSRIEAGSTAVNVSTVDIPGLCADIETMFVPEAKQKGLRMELEIAEDVPRHVHTDAGKLRQVLINLVGNAVKFTTEGQIDVTVRCAAPAAGASEQAVRLRIEVRDTGPGLHDDELGRLFEPFVQTRAGTALQQGSGLGLALCRHFVRMLGGSIDAWPGEERGAVFSFDIAAERVQVATGEAARAPESKLGLAPGQAPPRLLVVEDNPVNRALFVSILQTIGCEVEEACNGEEAIARWQSWQPDLIWMDMRMPVLDGASAVRRIRSAPGGSRTPIIALTASAFEEEHEEMLGAGCDDVVSKPFRYAEIVACLQRYLDLPPSPAESE